MQWDPPRTKSQRESRVQTTPEASRKAERLITMAADWNMVMALPAGLPTLEHTSSKNWTRPDNIWIDDALKAHIVKSDVLGEQRPESTDHLPFMLELDTSPDRAEEVARWDWRGVEWDDFREYVANGVRDFGDRSIETIDDFERELEELNTLLMSARDAFVPKVKTSPYMRRWWSKELGTVRTAVAKLARKAYAEGKKGCVSHEIHEEHRKARNAYSQLIKLAKKDHFIEWLERVDPSTIWDLHRFISAPASDGGKARVPTLRTLGPDGEALAVEGDEEKAKLFHETFFSPLPDNLQIPEDTVYPEPCMEMQELTEAQVDRAIRKMKPYKAAATTVYRIRYLHIVGSA